MGRRPSRVGLIGVMLAAVLVTAGCGKDEPSSRPTDPATDFTSEGGIDLKVVSPRKGATVSNPLQVEGRAPGSWSFEADFPLEVLDADRRTLGEGHATMKGEWTTESPVDFAGTVSFDEPPTSSGYLVLRKANPSGLPEHDDEVELRIRFAR